MIVEEYLDKLKLKKKGRKPLTAKDRILTEKFEIPPETKDVGKIRVA